ncbi:MAG: hypothetical protein GXO15_01985 [Crenarchaeota archaeon]|nr:hypothetical protein [Thermoproteota archaeon]
MDSEDGEPREIEELYLEARFACTALWARLRAREPGRAAALKRGLDALCGELRGLLEASGQDRVSRGFPRGLLEEPVGVLVERCRAAAGALRGKGSRAAALILGVLGG